MMKKKHRQTQFQLKQLHQTFCTNKATLGSNSQVLGHKTKDTSKSYEIHPSEEKTLMDKKLYHKKEAASPDDENHSAGLKSKFLSSKKIKNSEETKFNFQHNEIFTSDDQKSPTYIEITNKNILKVKKASSSMVVNDAMSPIEEQKMIVNKKSQEVTAHITTEDDLGLSANDSSPESSSNPETLDNSDASFFKANSQNTCKFNY